MADPGNGPWRILILDADPADPKWILATVTQPDHVRPANPEAAVVDEVTEAWVVHGSEVPRPVFTAMPAKCWRIDARTTLNSA
jgi:hypothetical protein